MKKENILGYAVIAAVIVWVSATMAALWDKQIAMEEKAYQLAAARRMPIIEHAIKKNSRTRAVYREYWTGWRIESAQRAELIWPSDGLDKYLAMMRHSNDQGISHHFSQIGWWTEDDEYKTIKIK